jgi:hypothetical protein
VLLLKKGDRIEMSWIKELEKQSAICEDGIAWASNYINAQAAWNACERGDWMLWAWSRNCGKRGSESHRGLVLACIAIARTSLKYIRNNKCKKACNNCLSITEKWAARGEEREITLEEIRMSLNIIKTEYKSWFSNTSPTIVFACMCACECAGYANDVVRFSRRIAFVSEKYEKYKKYAEIIRKNQPRCPRVIGITY